MAKQIKRKMPKFSSQPIYSKNKFNNPYIEKTIEIYGELSLDSITDRKLEDHLLSTSFLIEALMDNLRQYSNIMGSLLAENEYLKSKNKLRGKATRPKMDFKKERFKPKESKIDDFFAQNSKRGGMDEEISVLTKKKIDKIEAKKPFGFLGRENIGADKDPRNSKYNNIQSKQCDLCQDVIQKILTLSPNFSTTQ